MIDTNLTSVDNAMTDDGMSSKRGHHQIVVNCPDLRSERKNKRLSVTTGLSPTY